MKRILVLFILTFTIATCGFCSDKLPLKISPVSTIKSTNGELEVGDIIEFKLVQNIYKDDKILFEEGTKILGYIDFIKENGWCFDNAEIEFRKFEVIKTDGNIEKFNSKLKINGFDMLKYYNPKWKRMFQYIGSAFRGKEVDIKSNNNIIFNVWYIR